MNRAQFKAIASQSRQTGRGVEFKANGLRAYFGSGGVMYLDESGKVKRPPHSDLNLIASSREMRLFKAAHIILSLTRARRLNAQPQHGATA